MNLHIIYLIIFGFWLLIFNIVNLFFFIPITWFKFVYIVIFNSDIKFNSQNFFGWILFGLPYLIYLHFKNDIPLFFR